MEATPTPTPTTNTNEKTTPETFEARVENVTYGSIPPLRADVAKFLYNRAIPRTYVDQLLLSLTEVLTNLIKHPHHKASHIQVTIKIQNGRICLDVADDSTPFARFDAKCKQSLKTTDSLDEQSCEGGFGLGLVLRQHAEISYIPAHDSTDTMNHFIVGDKLFHSEQNEPQPLGATQKLLYLVDDDAFSLALHQAMLQGVYEVRCFESADAALEAFDVKRPDIIISDLNMPIKNGIELRKELSLRKKGDMTPFIFLSGQNEKTHAPYINRLGIDDYLMKPISKEKLLSVVARLVKRSEQYQNAIEGEFNDKLTDILRPQLPHTYGNWSLRVYNTMAEAGGGDFTIHMENSQRMFCLLADVMGHGRQAKFFSYAYSGYLRSMLRSTPSSAGPGYFLERFSQAIEDDPLLENMLVTCIAFHLRMDGMVRISAAGHPPPYILSKADCLPIDVAGPLPGIISESGYQEKQVALLPGEKILLGTDGFFDAFGGHLPKNLLPCASSLEDTGKHIWMDFLSRQEKNNIRLDDATMIIAEYKG